MQNQIAAVLSLLAVCVLYVSSAPSGSDKNALSKDELTILSKLVGPLKELAQEAEELEAIVERAAGGRPANDVFVSEILKRQGHWDMDYGWGGGRFGKRDQAKAANKRYDMYGMSGRFGRDVDHVDLENHDNQ